MLKKKILFSTLLLTLSSATAHADTLRLLTWGGYAPDDVVAKFEAETGHTVEVTKSNNEEMIAKLRATRGGGFDLAQPSQDRIAGPQAEFEIYKPLDLSKIDAELFIPSMMAATQGNTTVDGEVYGVPHVWGTSGLVLNTALAGDVKDYTDLCSASVAGKVDEAAYQEILDTVEAKLIECKPNVKAYWSGGDELKNLLRSGEVTAAMAWDTGGWQLNDDNKDITFVAPTSGALERNRSHEF